MDEAMRCFTLNGAYACMREDHIRGSIEPGKLADITVIDRNIIKDDPEDVLNMNILMTIVDGEIVFERSHYGATIQYTASRLATTDCKLHTKQASRAYVSRSGTRRRNQAVPGGFTQ